MNVMFSIPNIIGYCGVFIILYTYYQTHAGKIDLKSYVYAWQNITGALLILFSLYYHPNIPSIAIEIFWLAISFFGIAKIYWQKRKGIR